MLQINKAFTNSGFKVLMKSSIKRNFVAKSNNFCLKAKYPHQYDLPPKIVYRHLRKRRTPRRRSAADQAASEGEPDNQSPKQSPEPKDDQPGGYKPSATPCSPPEPKSKPGEPSRQNQHTETPRSLEDQPPSRGSQKFLGEKPRHNLSHILI